MFNHNWGYEGRNIPNRLRNIDWKTYRCEMRTYWSLFVVYLFIIIMECCTEGKACHPVGQKSQSLGDKFSWLGDIYVITLYIRINIIMLNKYVVSSLIIHCRQMFCCYSPAVIIVYRYTVALASNVPNWLSWRLTQRINKNYHIVSSFRLLSLLEVHATKPRSSRSCCCFTIAQSEQRILLREAYSKLLESTEVCITKVGVRHSI